MKSIIEEIYLHKRGVAETVEMSEKYREILHKVATMSDEFMKMLNEEQKQKFMEFCWETPGLEAENAIMHYKEGVKIGMLLAFECLVGL